MLILHNYIGEDVLRLYESLIDLAYVM